MPPLPLLGLVAIMLCLAPPAGAADEVRAACPTIRSDDVIAAAGDGGAFRLRSGREVRLLDLRPAPGGKAAATAGAWLASLAGEKVAVDAVGSADRWGRVRASLTLEAGGAIGVGELLVAEGLAIVDVGTEDRLCRPDLLPVEAAARTRRAGIWAEPGWPIPASDEAALAVAVGRFAVIEGRILTVGERRERTYLNFGRDWAKDFSVTIPRRSWALFKARGLDAVALKGRRVRVRGIVEMRRAPMIDLTVPEMLEQLDPPPEGRGRL